jgi:hypothetical protein
MAGNYARRGEKEKEKNRRKEQFYPLKRGKRRIKEKTWKLERPISPAEAKRIKSSSRSSYLRG